jgi:hypothetical protein
MVRSKSTARLAHNHEPTQVNVTAHATHLCPQLLTQVTAAATISAPTLPTAHSRTKTMATAATSPYHTSDNVTSCDHEN